MALDDIVSVTVTLESSSVSTKGFGTPLVAAYHTHNTDMVRTYAAATALTDMVSDSFSTSEPAYLAVAAILSANPRPIQVKVGRRTHAWTQIVRITPAAAVNDTVYSITIGGHLCSYTSDGTATMAEVCTGLATAITAASVGVTADGSSSTHIDVTTTAANSLVVYDSLNVAPSTMKVDDITADAGIAADLTAIQAADDDWYAFTIDSNANAEVAAAAAWAQTQTKIFGATLSGTRPLDSADTTDTASGLKASAYTRTFWAYDSDCTARVADAWIGVNIPYDPSDGNTWNFSTLSGIAAEKLSATQIAAIVGKCGNYYVTKAGVNVMRSGYMAKSVTTFIDQITLVDWTIARIQERVFALLDTPGGIPYSNESADRVCAEVLAVLYTGVAHGSLLADPTPTCTHPDTATIDTNTRSSRLLPDINFAAQTAGRIHSTQISGKLAV